MPKMYTASDAFFEALWELGITYCFVNLGSDHPSLLESIVKGQQDYPDRFPRIITCPNEMVAMSMADGYARYTSKPQCVIVHVDVGTQGLGAAVHNASCGRAPVLVFAGLSPYTCEGELRGSRTEYIHWIQDADQKQILAQYCRYAGEIKRGVNVKQMVGRAYQFAVSAPMGPVYLVGSREAMEEEIEEYSLNPVHWQGIGLGALPSAAVAEIAEALVNAEEPLLITGYSGRDQQCPEQLVQLANTVKGLRVLDTAGSDCCFPRNHPASLGLKYGADDSVKTADVILIADCDVPFIPTICKPKASAKIYHIDCDPLKQQMPVYYLASHARYRVDVRTAISQLNEYLSSSSNLTERLAGNKYAQRWEKLEAAQAETTASFRALASPPEDPAAGISISHLISTIRESVPQQTVFAVEAVTCSVSVADQLAASLPGSWINCGGGGLGWSGGAAMGIKLALEDLNAKKEHPGPQGPTDGQVPKFMTNGTKEKPNLVVQIVGDGTFLFSVPGSVYWIARRYNIPVLTIVLNNKGWRAPRRSLLLVHPQGYGSKVDNNELHISLGPKDPDYGGIARAAAGGWEDSDDEVEVINESENPDEAKKAAESGKVANVIGPGEWVRSARREPRRSWLWAARVKRAGDVKTVIAEAVNIVAAEGRSAVIDAVLTD